MCLDICFLAFVSWYLLRGVYYFITLLELRYFKFPNITFHILSTLNVERERERGLLNLQTYQGVGSFLIFMTNDNDGPVIFIILVLRMFKLMRTLEYSNQHTEASISFHCRELKLVPGTPGVSKPST